MGLASLPTSFIELRSLRSLTFTGCEELGYELPDELVDALEAQGCGVVGPGFDIETPAQQALLTEIAAQRAERGARLDTLRSEPHVPLD